MRYFILVVSLYFSSSASYGGFVSDLKAVKNTGIISKTLLNRWQSSPFFPELIAARSKKKISGVSIKEILELEKKYPESFSVSQIRFRKWRILGEQNEHDQLLKIVKPSNNVILNCYRLEAKFVLNKTNIKDEKEALKIWDHGFSRPAQCNDLFKLLVSKNLIPDDLRKGRIEKALENNELKLARFLAIPLSIDEKNRINSWQRARLRPETFLLNESAKYPEWSRMAAYKLAGQSPNKMLKLIENNSIPAIASDNAKVGALKRLAINNFPGLTNHLKIKLPKDPILDSWRVRYHIRQRNWDGVLFAIDQLPNDMLKKEEWQYWAARALEKKGYNDLAKKLFFRLAKNSSWFGFLASDRIKKPYNLSSNSFLVDEIVLERVKNKKSIILAAALFSEGLFGLARNQWSFALKQLSKSEKQVASQVALQIGWYSRTSTTATISKIKPSFEFRFPFAHRAIIEKTAKKEKISAPWISSVMRTESLFMQDIGSSAGAIGLMQIMPQTGKQVAMEYGIKWRGISTLLNPKTNIILGSRYLKNMKTKFKNLALSTAAYNAGPHRVRRWLPKKEMPLDVWVAGIPFPETRNYVQRVLSGLVIYQWRYTGEIKNLKKIVKQSVNP